MRKRAGSEDGRRRAGAITRRRFLERSAACIALPWAVVPVFTRGDEVPEAPLTSDTLAEGFRTPPDDPLHRIGSPNRLIGDSHLPPDKRFFKTNVRKFTRESAR